MARLIPCPLCGCPNYQAVFNIGKDKKIVRCKSCSMVYLNPMPTQKEMKVFYNSKYFFHKEGIKYGYGNYLELESLFHVMYRNWLKQLVPYLENNQKQIKILEVGCAAGYFLDIAKQAGYDVYGIEPSPIGTRAQNEYGEHIYLSTFEETEFQNNFFDLVVFFDLLEHIDNPIMFFDKVVSYLKPGGVIVLTTPNIGSIFRKLLGKYWFHFKIDHLNYFSKKTIRKLASRYNLKILVLKNCIKITNLNFILNRLQDYYGLKFPIRIKKNLENWELFKRPFCFPFSSELFVSMKKGRE